MTSGGSLQYTNFTATQSTITLENAKTITPTDDGVTVLFRLNMDATAQPQIDTITINTTLPASDSYYRVTIDDYTTNTAQNFSYFYAAASADTAAIIAANLAALINASTPNRPDVYAVVKAAPDTNQIDIISLLPGTNGAFTSTVACLAAASGSAQSGSPITKAVANGSGTGKVRSVALVTCELLAGTATANSPSFPQIQLSGTWYNGATPAVSQSTITATQFSGPLSFDALRAVT